MKSPPEPCDLCTMSLKPPLTLLSGFRLLALPICTLTFTHTFINDWVSLVSLLGIVEPGLVLGVHFTLMHLLEPGIQLDLPRLRIAGPEFTPWQHIEVCDCRKTRGWYRVNQQCSQMGPCRLSHPLPTPTHSLHPPTPYTHPLPTPTHSLHPPTPYTLCCGPSQSCSLYRKFRES